MMCIQLITWLSVVVVVVHPVAVVQEELRLLGLPESEPPPPTGPLHYQSRQVMQFR
jgi:hypothetical protein